MHVRHVNASAGTVARGTRGTRRAGTRRFAVYSRPGKMCLIHLERHAAGEPEGLLILHHGRGSDERDLLGLADVLDPERRLQVITPRAPLTLPGWPGYHWYTVPRVGHPDPATFHEAYRALAEFHDETWRRTGLGPAQTVFGGFSMGAVMSYTLGLPGERPVVAGILAFSGFIPTVEGWQPDLGPRRELPVLITHGREDPVINVDFGRRAQKLLETGGLPVTYLESDVGHQIDPGHIPLAAQWLRRTFAIHRQGVTVNCDSSPEGTS